MSNNSNSVTALVDVILQNSKQLEHSSDDAARKAVVDAASKLIVQLENPFEQLSRIGWGEPSRTAALRTAFELGLFKKLAAEPMNSKQLAEGTEADPELVARTMKHLAAYGFVNEIDKDKYTGTPFSMATNDPIIGAGLIYSFGGMIPAFNGLPNFLAKTKYQVPKDDSNGPFQFGLNTPKPLFGYMQDHPQLGEAFNKFMGAYAKGRPRWTDLYPCEERLLSESSDGKTHGPLLVDVGGGLGHDVKEFQQKFSNQPGKLILEDTPQVIQQCKESELPSTITSLAHDFFTPQPQVAVDSKAYLLRQILHDWPDEQCKKILSHIKDAMTPGHSKLLINENVLPDVGASWQQTSLDWTMMAVLVSQERTESHFRDLLESVGLKVVKIYEKPGANEKVIEAVREA